jgi:predicted secreted acid phosphatase
MPQCFPATHPGITILAHMEKTSDALVWALALLGSLHRLVPKPAIVLDIDGTVLKNYKNDVAKRVVDFQPFVAACVGAGITVFIVTARPDMPTNREWTERQLEQCGIWRHVEYMYMRDEEEGTGPFKYESREDIRKKGYTVLLSVGDQFLDLTRKPPSLLDNHTLWIGTLGDNGTFAIKLPSEFPKGDTPTP